MGASAGGFWASERAKSPSRRTRKEYHQQALLIEALFIAPSSINTSDGIIQWVAPPARRKREYRLVVALRVLRPSSEWEITILRSSQHSTTSSSGMLVTCLAFSAAILWEVSKLPNRYRSLLFPPKTWYYLNYANRKQTFCINYANLNSFGWLLVCLASCLVPYFGLPLPSLLRYPRSATDLRFPPTLSCIRGGIVSTYILQTSNDPDSVWKPVVSGGRAPKTRAIVINYVLFRWNMFMLLSLEGVGGCALCYWFHWEALESFIVIKTTTAVSTTV